MRTGRFMSRACSVTAAAGVAAVIAGCGNGAIGAGNAHTPPPAVSGAQAPVPAEHNPPGDIPDTTVYVPFQSASAQAVVKVPEGWARQQAATGDTFSSNLNSISIASESMTTSPTVAAARATTVPMLSRTTLAFRLQSVQAVSLAGDPAVEIVYQINSQPNAVTGRQYRLVVERFEFYRNGRGAVLTLSSAVGSDNVDPWRTVSESFRWV